MTDFAQRGPIGQKAPKQPRKARKPIPRQSARRKAYMASQARADGVDHMGDVAQCGCLVCGARPVEVHHEGKPRSDMRVLPLCQQHHRREYGPGAYHYSPKAFYAQHGPSDVLLARVDAMLSR